NQNYPEVMEQAKNPPEMEDGEDDKEALPPSHSYVWAYKRKDQEESPCQRSDQLFFRPDHEENPEKLPTPSPTKPEQRLNSLGQFFYNLLVTRSHPVAVSAVENKPKDITSSPGGHSVGTQPMDKTHRKHPQEEESHVPSKPSSSGSPAAKLAKEDFFETKLRHQLRLLVPNTAVRVFVVQAARALRSHCDLPAAQPACAKMVSKLGLLMKVLSDKQGGKGASALAGRCFLEANGTARPKAAGRKLTGKKKSEFARDNGLLIAISVSLAIILFLMLICLIEVSWRSLQTAGARSAASQCTPCCARPPRARDAPSPAALQGPPGSDPSGNKPPWLRDMYQPLDSQRKRSLAQKLYDEESSDEEEIFNKAELK
ncbi:L37A2 protein, partial [Crypturellus undulatus]|nr:L37A2 protein [Crypturellus undulatus]